MRARARGIGTRKRSAFCRSASPQAPQNRDREMRRNRHSIGWFGLVLLVAMALQLGCEREAETPPPEEQPAQGSSVAAPEAPRTSLDYRLKRTFDGGLTNPGDITLDTAGRIYIAGDEGVKVLDASGKILRGWSTPSPATSLALDEEQGRIYVGLRSRILVFDMEGKEVDAWGKAGKGRGELSYVTGIAVRGADVMVADSGNRVVHRFDPTGDFVFEIGERDREENVVGLVVPSPYLECEFDAEGNLHVNNPGRLRVEKYTPGGELLGFWGEAGIEPEKFCGCCNPVSFALMPDGRIATAEKSIPRVKIYEDGRMMAFMGPRFFSKDATGLSVAAGPGGRIYVTDPADGRVRVFAPAAEPATGRTEARSQAG